MKFLGFIFLSKNKNYYLQFALPNNNANLANYIKGWTQKTSTYLPN